MLPDLGLVGQGRSVAIVSMGQSALHFNSGSLSLLGHDGRSEVVHPLDAMESLPGSHPYAKVGVGRIKDILPRIKPMFGGCRYTAPRVIGPQSLSSDSNRYVQARVAYYGRVCIGRGSG